MDGSWKVDWILAENGEMRKGRSFMEAVLGVDGERSKNNLEVFTDSDWAGAGDMKSTSSAVHTLNGLVIFSTSRSQKCISLSSTEAEWYSASSGVCDALYLHHIISFITDDDIDPLTLHVDNSAVKMLSLKQGAGRLRHIKGRLLWLQSKVGSQELRIKQVKTVFNVSDVNTKPLQKDRFLGLLFLLGFTSSDSEVGADEFARLQSKELMKSQIKVVSRVLLSESAVLEPCQKKQSTANVVAKQVLRVLSICSLINLSEGLQVEVNLRSSEILNFHACMSPVAFAVGWLFSQLCQMRCALMVMTVFSCMTVASGDSIESSQALSLYVSPMLLAILAVCVVLGAVCFSMARDAIDLDPSSSDDGSDVLLAVEPEPEAEAEASPLQTFNGVKLYVFLAACSEHALQLQSSDDSEVAEQGGHLYQVVMDCFNGTEENGMGQNSVNIAMFAYDCLQNVDPTFTVDFNALDIENFNTGVLTEPDVEDMLPPDMDDEYAKIVLPEPFEEYSPEHMALWMIGRLSKRIKQCVEEGDTERCRRNAERRHIMVNVLKICRRDPSQRHRAAYMMQTIEDISPDGRDESDENTES